MGVWSSLKSPVWKTVPAGVFMKMENAPGMECVMAMKCTEKQPRLTLDPSETSRNLGLLILCSASLPSMSPRVILLAKMGTFLVRSMSRYGRAPVWSSWPWVITMPRSLCSFSRT